MTDPTPHGPITSIYHKTGPDMPVPADEECYYLLTRDGLFLGRNRESFRSLVPAPQWPRELDGQRPYLRLKYPKVPARLLARIVGFFWTIARRRGAEAIVLLAYDGKTRGITPIVPPQVGTIGWSANGEAYPIGLRYQIPPTGGLTLIGDIHSHAFEPAYASATDIRDVQHWPGLHVVAGRLDRDPPQWYVEFVVDGTRFELPAGSALDLEGYQGRRTDFDKAWTGRVRVEPAAGR